MQTRGRLSRIIGGTLVTALALAGCGSAGSHPSSQSAAATSADTSTTAPAATSANASTTAPAATTSTSVAHAPEQVPTADLTIASPAITGAQSGARLIASRYACNGADISPPITWSQVPANTVELDLFIFNERLVHGRLFTDWAVAGLKPGLHGLAAGRLPPGAVVGRNGSGQTRYSLCPPKGPARKYVILLTALTHRVAATPGFNADVLSEHAVTATEHEGELYFSYAR